MMGINPSNSFGSFYSSSSSAYEELDSKYQQKDRRSFTNLSEEDQKAQLVFEEQKLHESEIENPDLFKSYRYQKFSPRGPVTDEEYQVFVEVFTMLSSLGVFGLLKKMGKIEELQGKVSHVHPFNFLETIVKNPELKQLFIKVKKNNSLVWSRCKKSFKEEVILQNQLGNIKPHLCNFSRYMKVHPIDLSVYFNENKIEDVIALLLKNNSD